MKKFSVAIDGPSGAGKSSLAKAAAKRFGFIYVDTGAIYRTVAYATKIRGLDWKNEKEVISILDKIKIDLKYAEDGTQRMYLDGIDVSDEIRMPDISTGASCVSAIKEVRAYLLDMQRQMATENSVVMDGRDIGTVVLPKADLKIFLTASSEKRALRRMKEFLEKGVQTTYSEVLLDIETRDEKDSTRGTAPLIRADDALLLDTSDLSLAESLEKLCELINGRLS